MAAVVARMKADGERGIRSNIFFLQIAFQVLLLCNLKFFIRNPTVDLYRRVISALIDISIKSQIDKIHQKVNKNN